MLNPRLRMTLIASVWAPLVGLAGGAATAVDDKAGKAAANPQPTAASPAPAARAATAAWRQMRASKLIGSDVRNAQNENLGEIKDLVIDVNNARVHYAVLSFGGFLGLGDKLFAYPVGVFKPAGPGDRLVLDVDKEKLKAAPGFARDKYPEGNDLTAYRGSVDRYFGPTVALKSMPNQMLRRASQLIGKDVNDRNGKDVGEIEDLVVNLGNGRVHYAVLKFDKSWSLNDKLLAVPLNAFGYGADRKDLVMNVDKERLDTKLAFDKTRWPDINDPRYVADVDRHLVMMVPTPVPPDAAPSEVFARLDTDNDGKLTPAEAGGNVKVMGLWKQMDKDGDGSVSRAEFSAVHK